MPEYANHSAVLLNDITDPVMKARVELYLKEREEAADRLEANNTRLLDENKAAKRGTPDQFGPERINRSDASNAMLYQQAKARAEKRGVKLEIIDDSVAERTRVTKPLRFVHDETYYASHAHVRAIGPTALNREAAGKRVVIFDAVEDLPADAQAAMPAS